MPKYLDVKELSKLLKIKVSTVYAWVHQKKIPYRKHGRKLAFSVEEINSWSANRAVEVYKPLTLVHDTCNKRSQEMPDCSLKMEETTNDLTFDKIGG